MPLFRGQIHRLKELCAASLAVVGQGLKESQVCRSKPARADLWTVRKMNLGFDGVDRFAYIQSSSSAAVSLGAVGLKFGWVPRSWIPELVRV